MSRKWWTNKIHLQDPPRYSESMRDLQRLLDDGIWAPDVSLSYAELSGDMESDPSGC